MPSQVATSRLRRSFLRRKWRYGPSKDSGDDTYKMIYSAIQKALRVSADTLDGVPAPGLQGAIRGMLFIMDNMDRATQNIDDFQSLQTHIDSCQSIIVAYKGKPLPAAVKEAIMTLNESVDSISQSISQIVGRCRARRLWASSEDAQLFLVHVRTLGSALARFKLATATFIAVQSAQSLEIDRQLLLNKLQDVSEAHHKSKERAHITPCLENTRVSVIKHIRDWIYDPDAPSVFWLHGSAGTGKSTIAQSATDMCAKDGVLAGHFFFSRDMNMRFRANGLFTTLIHQVCNFELRLVPLLASAVMRDTSLSTARSDYIFSQLLVQPLTQLRSEVVALLFPMVVVIDALDECGNSTDADNILSLILKSRIGRAPRPILKFLVTSRAESSIRSVFDSRGPKFYVQHDLGSDDSRGDVEIYLKKGFKNIRTTRTECFISRSMPWPETYALNKLLKKSAGLFIYAATILKFVSDAREHPVKQLKLVLDTKSRQQGVHSELDSLYRYIVSQEPHLDRVHAVIGTVVLSFQPLSTEQIEILLGLDEGDAYTMLRPLQSVLNISTDSTQPIRVFHPSFHDFLATRERAEEFYLDPSVQHGKLAQACMTILQAELLDWTALDNDANSSKRELLVYACCYWPSHLSRASVSDALIHVLEVFLYSHVRAWFEAFIRLEILGRLLTSLTEILRSTIPDLCPDLCAFFCYEMDRFGAVIMNNYLHLRSPRPLTLAEGLHERAIGHFPKDRDQPLIFKYHLGRVQRRVYQQNASRNELETAFRTQQDLMRSLPSDDPERAVYLIETAVCYRIRYKLSLNPDDAKLSESLLQTALSSLPEGVNKSICYNSYGFAALERFAITKGSGELSQAIRSFESALKCPHLSPTLIASFFNNAGAALSLRFAEYGDDKDADRAILALTTAASSPAASPSVRFEASLELARCLRIQGKVSPLITFRSALSHGSNIIFPSLPDDEARRIFREAMDCGYEAASVAMETDDVWNVATCIDQASSILWKGGLGLSHDFFPYDEDQSRMQTLATILENEGGRDPAGIPSSDHFQTNSPDIPRLRSEYDRLSQRSIPVPLELRFEHLADTRSVLSEPYTRIILLAADHIRSFALVLQAAPTKLVLPVTLRASQNQLKALVQNTKSLWNSNWTSLGIDGKAILQEIWDLVVVDILAALHLKASSRPSRTWWCPSGAFMDLPIHAAINYRSHPREYLTDYMISSYISTVSSLFESGPRQERQGISTLLYIPPPPNSFWKNDSVLDLPAIRNVVPDSRITTISGRISHGVVFSHMRSCRGVHISSQSEQRPDNPADGGFILPENVHVELKQLLMQPILPRFAFLSTYPVVNAWPKGPPTCRLAFDLNTIGFSSVVATQCTLPPADSAMLVAYFYAELLKGGGGELDFDLTAQALHTALVRVREECDSVPKAIWVRVIHVGI